jgi:hypothetical protein
MATTTDPTNAATDNPATTPRQKAQHGQPVPSAEKIRAGTRSGVSHTNLIIPDYRMRRPNWPRTVSVMDRVVSARHEPLKSMISSSSDWKSRFAAGSKRVR